MAARWPIFRTLLSSTPNPSGYILHLTNLAKLIDTTTGTPLPDLGEFHRIIYSTSLCCQRAPVLVADSGRHTVSLVVRSRTTVLSDTMTRRFLLSDEGRAISTADEVPLRIYPNPAHNRFTVDGGTIADVTVADLTGRIAKVVATGSAIDISALKNGVYTLRITTTNGKTAVRKFVKR